MQTELFAEQGYLVGQEPLICPQTLARWVDELVSWEEAPGRHMVYYETTATGEREVTRIENFVPFHPGLAELLTGAPLLELVGQLLGEAALLFKDKINFKPPGGAGFDWHQDVQAGWEAYGSLHLSMMLPIDPCTRENGCLEVAPGWHRRGLLGPTWAPLPAEVVAQAPHLPLLLEPGQPAFFDSFLPHGSGPNHSPHPRRVLYATYSKASEGDQRERYYRDKRHNYPPDIEREPGRTYTYKV